MPSGTSPPVLSVFELGELVREELRALFASVLRSSVEHYRREHGYLVSRTQRAGDNPCGGSIRLGVALAEILRGLSGVE